MEASTRPQSSAVPHPAGDVIPDFDSSSRNEAAERESRGVTPRVVLICLALAVAFGYVIPIIDVKMKNTFLGAQHFPPAAVAVLLIFLLIINPVMKLLSRRGGFTRNELLTIYITCLFSSARSILRRQKINGWVF
jgi:hypothetical protein